MNSDDLITVNPEILGGIPVFKGTRVPVKTFFEYLENNYSLEEFLECFPSVTRDLACRVLERSENALLAPAGKYSWTSLSRSLFLKIWPATNAQLFRAADGLEGLTGELLRRATPEFDLFITCDQNIHYQQNLMKQEIAVLQLSTNDLRRIRAAIPAIQSGVASIQRSEFKVLKIPGFRRGNGGSGHPLVGWSSANSP